MSRSVGTEQVIGAVVHGLVVGVAATVVMSAVMVASQRAGLMGKLPPARVVERGAEAAGASPEKHQVDLLAGVAHIAFGTAAGVGFGVLASWLRPPAPEAVAIPWALAIWLVSYFGWIPALRILPAPHEDRPGRAASMLAAHVMYGVALGAFWRIAGRDAAR